MGLSRDRGWTHYVTAGGSIAWRSTRLRRPSLEAEDQSPEEQCLSLWAALYVCLEIVPNPLGDLYCQPPSACRSQEIDLVKDDLKRRSQPRDLCEHVAHDDPGRPSREHRSGRFALAGTVWFAGGTHTGSSDSTSGGGEDAGSHPPGSNLSHQLSLPEGDVIGISWTGGLGTYCPIPRPT